MNSITMTSNKRTGSDLEGAPSKKPRHDADDTSCEGRQGLCSMISMFHQNDTANVGVLVDDTTVSSSSPTESLMSIAQEATRQVNETLASAAMNREPARGISVVHVGSSMEGASRGKFHEFHVPIRKSHVNICLLQLRIRPVAVYAMLTPPLTESTRKSRVRLPEFNRNCDPLYSGPRRTLCIYIPEEAKQSQILRAALREGILGLQLV